MESWRDFAACAGLPPEDQKAFFGEAQESSTEKQHEAARVVCYLCPVQIPCLSYCVDTDTDFGVWGGLTESQRKRYLWPAIRREGRETHVLETVIASRGTVIFRIIQQLERSPQLGDHQPSDVPA